MTTPDDNKDDIARWNRKLLHAFWYSLLLLTVVACFNLLVTTDPYGQYVIEYIVWPTMLLLFLLLFTELLFRRFPRSRNLMLLSASGFTSIVIYIHAYVDSILLVYMFPVLIATFYFEKKYLWTASAFNVFSFVALYLVSDRLQMKLNATEVISTVALIGFGAPYIASKIIDRGVDILLSTRIDALSGLNNHKAFHDEMDKWIEQSRTVRTNLSLAILDIDNFKKINDTYGHQAGDEVIRRISAIMLAETKGRDIAARYGGEEFAILYVDRTPEEAYAMSERIRKQISELSHSVLNHGRCTVSIGICGFREQMTKEEWFEQADQNLYAAKRTGKNRTCL